MRPADRAFIVGAVAFALSVFLGFALRQGNPLPVLLLFGGTGTMALSSKISRRVLVFIGAGLWWILGWDIHAYMNYPFNNSIGNFIVLPVLVFYVVAGFVLIWIGTGKAE